MSQTRRPEVENGGRTAFLLAVVAGFTAMLLFPDVLSVALGGVLAVAAVVLGVRARQRGRSRQVPAPAWLAAVITGSLVLVMVALLGLSLLLLDEILDDYDRCSDRALTRTAQQQCDEQLRDQLEERTGVELGLTP